MRLCLQKHVYNKLSGDSYSMAFEDLLETSGKIKFVHTIPAPN